MKTPHRVSAEDGLTITLIGFACNGLLAVGKAAIGWWAGSRALLADALHSVVDLSTDLAVIFAVRMGRLPKDASHPYGHERFNTVAQAFVAFSLMAFALGIIFFTLRDLRSGNIQSPAPIALVAAIVSIAVKEVLFHMTMREANKLNSRLLRNNAWHHRSDSLSSVLVVVVLAITLLAGPNWAFLDPLLGFLLGGFLLVLGFGQMRQALADLVDRAPERRILDDFREHILTTPGSRGYHDFRARRVGDRFEVDLHLQVDENLTIREGHEIARQVKQAMMNRHPEVNDVLIHLEPADAERLQAKGISGRQDDPEQRLP